MRYLAAPLLLLTLTAAHGIAIEPDPDAADMPLSWCPVIAFALLLWLAMADSSPFKDLAARHPFAFLAIYTVIAVVFCAII